MKTFATIMAVLAMAAGVQAAAITGVTVNDSSGYLMNGYDATKSIDDNTSTLWYSEMSNDVAAWPWVVYNLGDSYSLNNTVVTMSDGNYRKLAGATISVSTDNVSFTTVGTFAVDVTDLATTNIDLSGYTGQYIKLEGVEAFYANWGATGPEDYCTPGTAPDGKYAISYAEIDFDGVPAPEPMTMSLLAIGGMAILKRRRK